MSRAKKRPADEKDPFLARQRARLEALRAHHLRRGARVEADLAREGGLEADFEEQAVVRENDEVLAALSAEGREQLDLVEAALASIEAGRYGTCAGCGEPIARARLEALPYARSCLACAEKRLA